MEDDPNLSEEENLERRRVANEEHALVELFKKQRPGEPPSVDAAKNLIFQLFFDPKRYDLTRVGRYKLNSRLHLDTDLDTRVLTHADITELIRELVSLPKEIGIPESGGFGDPESEDFEPIKDFAAGGPVAGAPA